MLTSQHKRAVLHKAAHQVVTVWKQNKAALAEDSIDKQRRTLGRGAPYRLSSQDKTAKTNSHKRANHASSAGRC
jgi:hypothetical protein